jgi:hypothetical protein
MGPEGEELICSVRRYLWYGAGGENSVEFVQEDKRGVWDKRQHLI